MSCRPFWLVSLIVCQLLLAGAAVAQEPAATESPTEGNVREAATKIYWLRDENGKLVPLLGHTLDEILRLLDRQNQVPAAEKPLYEIRQLTVSGTAHPQHAALNIEIEVAVMGTDWVRVPLRLGEAVLKKAAYQGAGEHLLEYAEDGHVCWIKSKNDQPHKITIETLVRLNDAGGEQRLRLTAPLSLKSSLRLRVPVGNPITRLSDRAVLEVKRKLGNKQSELVVSGLDSAFELAWRHDDGSTARSTTVFEATTGLLVTVNGPSIRTAAQISLTGLQGNVETLRVRLPSGAKLLPDGVETATGEPLVFQADGSVVDVKLPEKITPGNTFECVLLTEQFAEQTRFTGIEGFEVLGAARQSGHVAIRVEGDWQLTFKRQGVWEFDIEKLPEALQGENVETGFEYFHPRWTLSVRIDRRQPRVSVEPAYTFVVTQDEVQLEARLKYTVRSAAVNSLLINPNGWEFDLSRVESNKPDLLDLDRVVEAPNSLEFRLAQRQQGTFEVILHGTRKLSAESGRLELTLPRPKYDSLGPASVVVQAADNIELTPKSDEMVGMSRRPLEMVRLAMADDWQQPPLVYRTSVSTARFVAEMDVHSRRVSADVISRVHLTASGGNVTQRLRFRVEYEPLSEVLLMVPAPLHTTEVLKVRVGDADVAITPASNQPESAPASLMRVLLPMRSIGLLDVEVSFALSEQPVEPGSGIERVIPLVMPAEANRIENRLLVTADEHLLVEPAGTDWTLDEQTLRFGRLRRGGPQRFTCNAWMTESRLRVLREASQQDRATQVERAWIQSRIAAGHRRDRAVYRLSSSDPTLAFRLPAGVPVDSVKAFIDTQPAEALELQPGTGDQGPLLTLELPAGNRQDLVVELTYDLHNVDPGELTQLRGPQLPRDVYVERLYWELVLPAREHLLWGPDDLTAEMTWQRYLLLWGRQPSLSQAQLEQWSGAAENLPPPADSNRYLFGSLTYRDQLQFQVVSRSLLVLVGSGSCLVVGLMLIYLPSVRSVGLLYALGIAIAALAVVYPEPGLLFAQAAGLGVVLVLVSAWLHRGYYWKRRRGAVVRAGAAVSERKSTDLFAPVPVNAETSTASASVALNAEAESKV